MQKEKTIRIVVDTNIFISFLIGRRLKNLKHALSENLIALIYCEQSLKEIKIVTSRPKLQKYFKEVDVIDLIELIKSIGHKTIINKIPSICRDPKDNYILGLAAASNADFIVTGDDDLLILKQFQHSKIITYKELEKILA